MSASHRVAVALLTLFALGACKKGQNERTPDAAATAAATATPLNANDIVFDGGTVSREDGRALVVSSCLSCHSEEMLAEQRLTQAQWQKTVTKMVGWGATLAPSEVDPLVAYLAATSGLDAGAFEPARVPPGDVEAAIAPEPDPFPPGDPERGHALFTDKCSGCHGPDARGHIGVLLVERPLLYRAKAFGAIVRKGRGKMTPTPLTDVELADVLAWLRTLKVQ